MANAMHRAVYMMTQAIAGMIEALGMQAQNQCYPGTYNENYFNLIIKKRRLEPERVEAILRGEE